MLPLAFDGDEVNHDFDLNDSVYVSSLWFYQIFTIIINSIVLYIIRTDSILRGQRSIVLLINVSVADLAVALTLGSLHFAHVVMGGWHTGKFGCGWTGIMSV